MKWKVEQTSQPSQSLLVTEERHGNTCVARISIQMETEAAQQLANAANCLPELIEALKAIRFAIDTHVRDTIWVDGWKGAGNGVHITAHDVIDEVLDRAETVLTDGK